MTELVNKAEPESQHQSQQLIRNISDTARWVAVYRADENDRPDALFRDPFARRLAGQRGEEIASAMPFQKKNSWPFVARTYLFDAFINEQVRQGAEMVVNLAAGLDARPYRMALPPSLQWVEVDLPGILDYKEEILGSEKPVCALERIRLDLADGNARRELFERLGQRAKKVLVVTEGLLGYLSEDEAGSLAVDLAHPASFQRWVLDIGSPALMRMIQEEIESATEQGGRTDKIWTARGSGFLQLATAGSPVGCSFGVHDRRAIQAAPTIPAADRDGFGYGKIPGQARPGPESAYVKRNEGYRVVPA